ncbi:MAG: 30S ribosomal protein S20 [Holosporaceae bacterium]|jgi:small subunit ribosomal protein S20|nr:30S ribosomal protein S20 [Holosporaceae bacterium]
MANHKSALKRIRQRLKETGRNRNRISRIRTFIKKFTASLGSTEALAAFSSVQSEIQKGVSKGVLHRNAASRKIARLNKILKSAEAK